MLSDVQFQKLDCALRNLGTVQAMRKEIYLAMQAGEVLDVALAKRVGSGHTSGSAEDHLVNDVLSRLSETRQTVLTSDTQSRLEGLRQSTTDADVAELERLSKGDGVSLPAWTEKMSDIQLLEYVKTASDDAMKDLFQRVGKWFQKKGVL